MEATSERAPKTLIEAISYFKDIDNCINYLAKRRWPRGVECPTCGRKDVAFVPSRRLWQCKTRHPKAQFSIKTGTVLEDSPIGLDKWLPVIWQVATCKNGVSSWEIHRNLGVTQKTAWFMLHRVRLGMQDKGHGGKIGGEGCEVEIDETLIGGKARNMHKERKVRAQKEGRNTGGKAVVMGMLERGKTVRVSVIADRTKSVMQPIIRANVELGTNVMSDEWASNYRMDDLYNHEVVNHLETYVNGNVHTNGMENFWSCLKRTIGGTYVPVEPFHLFPYVDEQAFRFNNRKPMTDPGRFSCLCRKIVGKRITYAGLTGKVGQKQEGGTLLRGNFPVARSRRLDLWFRATLSRIGRNPFSIFGCAPLHFFVRHAQQLPHQRVERFEFG
jgi:transposase-like protein